ncbi:MAG TPA: CPBP family intramembrane glutamic endopeptidase [Pyrinomonadaceae bacterium]|nr:CPBP family intramembrane glutamic endopeptidase [Pyrinomonadaceae bacterium]
MTSRTRLFLILWLAGMAGVLSFLLVDISALIAAMPVPEGASPAELPRPAILKLVTLIQPSILTALAVIVGIWLAPRVGLHAPAAEAASERSPIWPAFKPQLLPGVLAGLSSGAAIAFTWVIAKPSLPAEFIVRAEEFNKFIPAPVRILYGGFTEEILLRWGVMTFLVWLMWKLFQRGRGNPQDTWLVLSILVSALLFGIGHLPVASAIAGGLTVPIIVYVIIGNSLFGIVAGFLYWRRGLEAAMVAHMTAHLVIITAIFLAL